MNLQSYLLDRIKKVVSLSSLDVLKWSYWKWNILFFALNMLIYPLSRAYLGSFGGRSVPEYNCTYLEFLIVGIIINSLIMRAQFLFTQQFRSIQQILFTPLSMPVYFIGRSLWNYILYAIEILAYTLVGLYFGMQLNINLFFAIPVFILSFLTMVGFSLISQGARLGFKTFDPTEFVLMMLSYLFSGTLFPVESLPPELQVISWMLPQTYILHLGRLTLLRGSDLSIFTSSSVPEFPITFLKLAFVCVIIFTLGVKTFKWGLKKAKTEGYLNI